MDSTIIINGGYDPTIGRFISQDSDPGHLSNPQSLNYYVYVWNNPTTNTDPTGECPWCIAALIGAGVGAALGYGLCVANGGGWTSGECGKAALDGAVVVGLAVATFGISLAAQPEQSRLVTKHSLPSNLLVPSSRYFSNLNVA